jgi:hypothetical protein
MAESWLELGELTRVEPFRFRRLRAAETTNPSLVQRDLNDAITIERDREASALAQPFDVGGVSIARGRCEIARVPVFTFDRWREQSRRSERSGADSRLADDAHAEPPQRGRGTAGEADEPTPDDENVGDRG